MQLKRKNSKSGLCVRHPGAASAPRTFVVLGAPRGGTSLVAGALRLVGIFMGDDTDPANNEDRAFNFHGGNLSILTQTEDRVEYLERIRQTIEQRNSSHSVWGWKDPLAALYVEDILPSLINPHLILVTRDITATAMRERIEASNVSTVIDDESFHLAKAGQALGLYQSALSVIERSNAPALLLSYEKSIRNVEDFAAQILEFSNVKKRSTRRMGKVAESIALYARDGSISADLAHRPTPMGRGKSSGSDTDLSRYPDLPTVYHRCATLINLRHYEQGLALARVVLAQAISDFDAFPQLKSNPIIVAEVEGGMWFMAALAQINLGDAPGSFMALGRFNAMAKHLHVTGHKSELMEGIMRQATDLMRLLERELRK